jgi:hypothetical protein
LTNDITSFYQGYALGQQIDMTATSSECYAQATAVGNGLSNLWTVLTGTSLSSYDSTLMNQFLTNGNDLLVQSSLMGTVCQDVNKIKQLMTRTNTLAGAFNTVFTIGYQYYK